jgi:transcriptional regulator with XRE-family HTH domain
MDAVLAAVENERLERELNYSQTAREIGITYRQLLNWRQGHCVASGDVLLRVCQWTGRSITEFARQDPLPGSRGQAA